MPIVAQWVFIVMTLIVPIYILIMMHVMWKWEWQHDRFGTVTVRSFSYMFAASVIGIWSILAMG